METATLLNHPPLSWFRNLPRTEKQLAQPRAKRAIAEVRETLVTSLNAGDLDRWSSLFAADAVQMPPHAAPNNGRNSIRAWGQTLMGCLHMRVSLSPDDFQASGDLAFESGSYDSRMTVRHSGEVLSDHGKYVVVYRRDAHNHWAIAREIWNSDKPDLAFRGSRS